MEPEDRQTGGKKARVGVGGINLCYCPERKVDGGLELEAQARALALKATRKQMKTVLMMMPGCCCLQPFARKPASWQPTEAAAFAAMIKVA